MFIEREFENESQITQIWGRIPLIVMIRLPSALYGAVFIIQSIKEEFYLTVASLRAESP